MGFIIAKEMYNYDDIVLSIAINCIIGTGAQMAQQHMSG